MSANSESLLENHLRTHSLVADIGGTHARFAIAYSCMDGSNKNKPELENRQTYQVAEFESLAVALQDYLNNIPRELRPSNAILAVASAVTDDHIVFTNSPWSFSISALKKELDLNELIVINDFAAVAWALPSLSNSDVDPIGPPHALHMLKPGVYAALGPGTGLGVAALKFDIDRSTVLETEGGHIGFSPRSDDEILILQYLQKHYERVSYERLLCGNGLLNIYRARCDLMKLPVVFLTPAEVSSGSRQGDPAAMAAATDFCSILGAFAGDTALMFGAWQGVFLSGGLLPHLMDEKGKNLFRQAFESKGRFSSLLVKTPTWIIKRTDIGKLGAASLWLGGQKKNKG
jgi:glucokinase